MTVLIVAMCVVIIALVLWLLCVQEAASTLRARCNEYAEIIHGRPPKRLHEWDSYKDDGIRPLADRLRTIEQELGIKWKYHAPERKDASWSVQVHGNRK